MLLGHFFSTPCFPRSLPAFQWLLFKDDCLKQTSLLGIPCGVMSFLGKYPLRGQFWTVYSHTSFMLTFLPLAVTWAMSPRRGRVRCPAVWERRNGSLFLIAWLETCEQETQKSTYWKWMMSRGWSAVSPFPQKGGPSFQTVERASGLRWGQEPRLLLFPSLFSHHPWY